MKFVQFVYKNKPNEIRSGYLAGDTVIDFNKCDSSIPPTMLGILNSNCPCKIHNLDKAHLSVHRMCDVKLIAPITGIDKVVCLANNYTDFCKEKNVGAPETPVYFSKFASCIIGPNDAIKLRSEVTEKVDWEVELAVVIGTKCTSLTADMAMTAVLGYTVAQDITSRDWQTQNGGHFLLGKAQDTFCPIGPCIASVDEICDPHNLDIKCSVNGVVKQQSNTSRMVHRIPQIIERISSVMTLLPGDIVLTGTPAGIGCNREPPEFLEPGDVLRSEIERIGAFENEVEDF